MSLRIFVAKDFAGMSLLTVVPVISVIRLTFQEQYFAFVLALPDASKPQPLALRGAAVTMEESPSREQNRVRARQSLVGTSHSLFIWKSNSLE